MAGPSHIVSLIAGICGLTENRLFFCGANCSRILSGSLHTLFLLHADQIRYGSPQGQHAAPFAYFRVQLNLLNAMQPVNCRCTFPPERAFICGGLLINGLELLDIQLARSQLEFLNTRGCPYVLLVTQESRWGLPEILHPCKSKRIR